MHDVTGSAWTLVAVFLVFALLDWVAVAGDRRSLEVVAKPFAMVPLIGAALAVHPADEPMRGWFVAALAFSLVGDVLLLDHRAASFRGGLAAFLVAHLCYVVGFVLGGVEWWVVAVALALVLGLLAPVLPRLLGGVRRQDPGALGPVMAYVGVITIMFATACGSTVLLAAVGAASFLFSDLVIGWTRFVRSVPAARLMIMVTYHLGQLLLVLSLVIGR
jgi:uncharacterized membrane protein YhhN